MTVKALCNVLLKLLRKIIVELKNILGRVAQLVEQNPDKVLVEGSNPSSATRNNAGYSNGNEERPLTVCNRVENTVWWFESTPSSQNIIED